MDIRGAGLYNQLYCFALHLHEYRWQVVYEVI